MNALNTIKALLTTLDIEKELQNPHSLLRKTLEADLFKAALTIAILRDDALISEQRRVLEARAELLEQWEWASLLQSHHHIDEENEQYAAEHGMPKKHHKEAFLAALHQAEELIRQCEKDYHNAVAAYHPQIDIFNKEHKEQVAQLLAEHSHAIIVPAGVTAAAAHEQAHAAMQEAFKNAQPSLHQALHLLRQSHSKNAAPVQAAGYPAEKPAHHQEWINSKFLDVKAAMEKCPHINAEHLDTDKLCNLLSTSFYRHLELAKSVLDAEKNHTIAVSAAKNIQAFGVKKKHISEAACINYSQPTGLYSRHRHENKNIGIEYENNFVPTPASMPTPTLKK
jgi:hypothetical protein